MAEECLYLVEGLSLVEEEECFTDLLLKEGLNKLVMDWYVNWLEDQESFLKLNIFFRRHSITGCCCIDTFSEIGLIPPYVLNRLHFFLGSFPVSKKFIIWKKQKPNSITCFNLRTTNYLISVQLNIQSGISNSLFTRLILSAYISRSVCKLKTNIMIYSTMHKLSHEITTLMKNYNAALHRL